MKNRIIYLYLATLFVFTLFSFLFIDQNLGYLHSLYTGISTTYKPLVAVVYMVLISFLFFLYIYFLKKSNKLEMALIKRIVLISSLILVFSYPAMLSYDIFNYMATSRVSFFYKENPYLVMPMEFTGDPMLSFTRAANKLVLYGPVWVLLTAIPYFLGLGNFVFELFWFKVLSLVFFLGTVYLLTKLSKKNYTVVFFALNPLVIIETLNGSHNDIAMVFFALGAFYMIKKDKVLFSLVLITASILIKFATIILLPVIIYVFYSKVRLKQVNWNKIWIVSSALLFLVFLLSPIREEMYSWYAIWFIAFVSLLDGYAFLKKLTVILSFGLMLSYLPYMYLGHYLFPTVQLKYVIIATPLIIFSLYTTFKKHASNI